MSGREEVDLGGVELVAVAKAVRVRGLKGEVVCELLTDFPERFEWVEELIGVAPSGERSWLALERHWLQKGRVVLKFEGYDTPEAAQGLVGWELTVPESEAVELEEGEYYDWQLVGCRVETVDNRNVGTVREVLARGRGPRPRHPRRAREGEPRPARREHLRRGGHRSQAHPRGRAGRTVRAVNSES